MKRRAFLSSLGIGSAAAIPFLSPIIGLSSPHSEPVLTALKGQLRNSTNDADFWGAVRKAYFTGSSVINFNNGGVSPQPRLVQEAEIRETKTANEAPAYQMWRIQKPGREIVREKLARLTGCEPEEIALVRNATEALEILLLGYPLESGDEVLCTDQDYPSMINAIKQMQNRKKIVLKTIPIPVPLDDEDALVEAFKNAITRKTKLILMCHMINLTGQVLPVRKVVDMAHANGLEVIVDGAHSFAHIDFKIEDLGCDYFGTSLHKWLCAPFGTGLLYIKKNKIPDIWPLFAAPEEEADKMSKFEHFGTYPVPKELAISEAIDFHEAIGIKRKASRLAFLSDYWTKQVKDINGVFFNTSFRQGNYGAIVNFGLDGIEAPEIQRKLFQMHRIYTISIHHDDVKGVRVSPHIYTSMEELDLLAQAIREIALSR